MRRNIPFLAAALGANFAFVVFAVASAVVVAWSLVVVLLLLPLPSPSACCQLWPETSDRSPVNA